MRPIDADALKKAMDRYWGTCQRIRKPRNGETAVFLDVRATVEKQPTIDAVPVRHGRWVERWVDNKHRIGDKECSVCGGVMLDCPSYSLYCPWCGARMDGTQKKPCDDCQEFDCYGCEHAERKEE